MLRHSKTFKIVLDICPKLSQPTWTTENHADNQISKAGFMPLCNKIPFSFSYTVLKENKSFKKWVNSVGINQLIKQHTSWIVI